MFTIVSEHRITGTNPELADYDNPRGYIWQETFFFLQYGNESVSCQEFNSRYHAELFLESGQEIDWRPIDNLNGMCYDGSYDRDAELRDWQALGIY